MPDPDGTLFYNNLSDLSGPMDYRFWHNSGTTDDEAAAESTAGRDAASPSATSKQP